MIRFSVNSFARDAPHIRVDHLGDQLLERRAGRPTKARARLRGIALQRVDFGRTEELGVDDDEALIGWHETQIGKP